MDRNSKRGLKLEEESSHAKGVLLPLVCMESYWYMHVLYSYVNRQMQSNVYFFIALVL